jgi:hypothetical protein
LLGKEPIHTLQRSEQKKLDKIKRVRGTLEAAESPPNEAEKATITECARELDVDEETKLQEMLLSIAT